VLTGGALLLSIPQQVFAQASDQPLILLKLSRTVTDPAGSTDGPRRPPLIVSIDAAGDTYIGDIKFEADELKVQLAALAAAEPNHIVYVRGDRTIEYGKLVDVLGLIYAVGFTKVSLIVGAARPQ